MSRVDIAAVLVSLAPVVVFVACFACATIGRASYWVALMAVLYIFAAACFTISALLVADGRARYELRDKCDGTRAWVFTRIEKEKK